jgi:hypothetical protein
MMKIKKLNKQELIELVKKISNADFDSEEEGVELRYLLRSNVLDPYITDYIFSNQYDLTAEEIVEKALSYKPIILGPATSIEKK